MFDPIPEHFLTEVGEQWYQDHPYHRSSAYLRSLYALGTTPLGRVKLTDLLENLPEITKVSGSTIILRPEATDTDLFAALREIVQQQVLFYRDGKSALISPSCFRSGQAEIVAYGKPIWCIATIYNLGKNTKITISPCAQKNATVQNGKLIVPTYKANAHQHDQCVNDCAAAIQSFLDEIYNTLTRILYHGESLVLNPLPKLERMNCNEIVFSGLNTEGYAYQSGITTVLNRVKNIYAEGDAKGRNAYRYKRSMHSSVANDRFRIIISFTIHKRNDQLIVQFLYDFDHNPYLIVPRSHNRHQKMTRSQAKEHRKAFAHSCATALQAYFTALRTQAALSSTSPDYWQPWPPHLTRSNDNDDASDMDTQSDHKQDIINITVGDQGEDQCTNTTTVDETEDQCYNA